MHHNLLTLADSYKYSHPELYKPDLKKLVSYMEARQGGDYPGTVFFGLQYYLKEYLSKPFTEEDIQDLESLAAHGVPLPVEEFKKMLRKHNGYLPVRIRAVKEGAYYPCGTVLMTIEGTDPEFPWIGSFLETLLMKVWYPTTIATKSFFVKKAILQAGRKHFEDLEADVPFMYHNFGDRGSTSVEAAALGGMAHLTQFLGTDNFNSLRMINKFYPTDDECAGFSIPASEHSTVTSWGRDKEYSFYDHFIESYRGRSFPVACVMDSYNIFKAVDYVTSGERAAKIESSEYPIFVIRPDSGEPLDVIPKILSIMMQNEVSYQTVNGKILFNKYRIIWGDGITPETIVEILEHVASLGFSMSNMAFGSGGDLMQNVNRDTCRFAIKACSAEYSDGNIVEVYKQPLHSNKNSLKGCWIPIRWKDGKWNDSRVGSIQNIRAEDYNQTAHENLLEDVFINGAILRQHSLDEIRSLSEKDLLV